jgi:hypothetical protein
LDRFEIRAATAQVRHASGLNEQLVIWPKRGWQVVDLA